MSAKDYATTPCSEQYYNMFIRDDLDTFNQRKKLINGKLKPAYEAAHDADRLASMSLYSAKGQYMTALYKNSRYNKMLDDLRAEKKLAEDNARKAALARGCSIEEADRIAEQAGKAVQAQIDNAVFFNSYEMNETITKSKAALDTASENSTAAHSSYMSASSDLDSSLFSQQMLASNIHKNTVFYTGMQQIEQATKWQADA